MQKKNTRTHKSKVKAQKQSEPKEIREGGGLFDTGQSTWVGKGYDVFKKGKKERGRKPKMKKKKQAQTQKQSERKEIRKKVGRGGARGEGCGGGGRKWWLPWGLYFLQP